jgi:fucose permease
LLWVFHYSRPLHSLAASLERLILRQGLNPAGGINSLGTTIGPIVVSIALFGVIAGVNIEEFAQKENSLDSMRILYVFVGGLFLLAAALFYQKKLPDGKRILLLNPQVKDEDFNCYYGNFDSYLLIFFSL